MFTVELGVTPDRLELFRLGQIVDHLEYLTARGGNGGDQT